MASPSYFATVAANGALTARCPALAGCDVVIRERKAQRSTRANSRYWGLLTAGAKELGYDDVEELHEGIALKLLPLPQLVPGIARRRRTPSLNTKEFAEYQDAAERLLRQMGCDLEEWDEQTAIMEGTA